MSYCELIVFREGKPDESFEYPNAFGGSARIWTALFDKYLKDPDKEYDSWITCGMFGGDGIQCLWDLSKREDLLLFERAVHVSTFDRAIVRQENFQRYAEHLLEFVAAYPAGNTVCHLRQWARLVGSKDFKAEAIGFYGTSVSDNLWEDEWDEETEECIPYDLNVRDDHFEVYGKLKS